MTNEPKKISIFIDSVGTMRTIEPEMAKLMGLRRGPRFSYIEPANRHLRRLYMAIRARVSDDSFVAAWTRLWPVLWRVRVAHSTQILGTYWSRKAAIRGEKDFFSTGRWIPGYLNDHTQSYAFPDRERDEGPEGSELR